MTRVFAAAWLVLTLVAAPPAQSGNAYPDLLVDPGFAPASPDPGWRRVFISGIQDEKAIALARTPDGGFISLISVPGGAVGSKIGLVRHGPNGALVSGGFGTSGDGKVVKDAYLIELTGMLVDRLGRIVVIGTTPGPGGLADFGVVRFNPDGSDDTSFAGDGGVAVGMEPIVEASDDRPVAIVEQVLPGGSRLVIAGNTLMQISSGPLQRFGLIGLRDDGSFDPDFGNYSSALFDGRVNDSYGADTAAYASSLLKLPGNDLIIGGTIVLNGTDTDFGACYLTVGGSPYADYASCVTLGIDEPGPGGSIYDGINAMALANSTTFVAAGTASGRMAAARFSKVGSTLVVDQSFAGSSIPGRGFRFVGSAGSYANDVAVQSDGRIKIVGRHSGTTEQGAVQALTNTGAPDVSFSPSSLYGYQAPLTGSGTSIYTEFKKVLLDAGRPVLFGSSPDDASTQTDFDGVLTRLTSDRIFAAGYQ